MNRTLNPRLWLIAFGLLNLAFGAVLFFISGVAVGNIAETLGATAPDAITLEVASTLHQALGMLWACLGALSLSAALGNKGENEKVLPLLSV